MSVDPVEAISRAVLYEGYALYPYRPSALKNRRRWMLGGLYPRAWAEAHGERWCARAQCLLSGSGEVEARARFLQGDDEREVGVTPSMERVADGVWRITVELRNPADLPATASREEADARCLWSAQAILRARGGEFISLADPPPHLRDACRQDGLWPALIARDAVLASPVILQDFPRIAPESPGDLFDATEIDEILSLRILTLTPEEKQQARASSGRVRALLDRVEALGADGLRQLHGAIRGPKPGDQVHLRPTGRADIMDLALAGKRATVVAVEVDFEDRTHVVVTVDDDPGKDLPGHRFYFGVHEVEPL
ncbi:MAG TPA: hypothetical protein VFA20_05580 [Myxococcaceae bacterium]|nr:hypothetical protein [Myxococcaceae bacterium]